MKKLLAILLCIALLACVFTFVACDDKDDNSSNGNPAASDESRLEDFVGKLATYVLENLDDITGSYEYDAYDYQMNFNLPEEESIDALEWYLSCGGYFNYALKDLYLIKFNNETAATENLQYVKEVIVGLEMGGTYFQDGNVIIWDSGDGSFYNTIKNSENKINSLLSAEAIARYKYNISKLILDDNYFGYAYCVFHKEGEIYSNTVTYQDETTIWNSYLCYLLDDASDEMVKDFNDSCDNHSDNAGEFVKVSDKFFYTERTIIIEDEE